MFVAQLGLCEERLFISPAVACTDMLPLILGMAKCFLTGNHKLSSCIPRSLTNPLFDGLHFKGWRGLSYNLMCWVEKEILVCLDSPKLHLIPPKRDCHIVRRRMHCFILFPFTHL